jgi:diaminohydroxyphosphoribosylaminopyrimidine deaminase/5-amino-6-(5-phosphoribosylamino)uracil reductase
MRQAIGEARLAMGKTHPNPAVGAVIVHKGSIVARGHTQPPGGNHAEIEALQSFQHSSLDVDASTELYVTMEPCSTTGRTGPCTEAIKASGITKVVVGAIDPNPDHAGKGLDQLRDAGIDVCSGVLEVDCEDLNLIYNWRLKYDQPFVAGKVATTIDGRIATRGGSSKWVTGPSARADVHRWRRYFPAIAVGAGTVLADDPSLTARIEGEEDFCPIRFVFDRHLITFKDGAFKVYSDEWKGRTIVITGNQHAERAHRLEKETGIRFWAISQGAEDGGFPEFFQRCKAEGVDGIYAEGGASLGSSLLKYRILNYIFCYRAPTILADTSGLAPFMGQEPATMNDAIQLSSVRHASFDDDQLMRGFVVYPENG